jgi:membrane protein
MTKKSKNERKKIDVKNTLKRLWDNFNFSKIYSKVKSFSKHYFGGIYNRIDEHHVFLLAGGLAFSLFICIIPFVLIIFAVLGTILDSQYMQYQVNLFIDTIIPYYQYSEFVKKIIFTRINEVIEYKNLAGLIGGIGLLFAASGLFSSMRTILNTVFGVQYDVHFVLAKLRDFAMVLMVIIIFFVTTVAMPIIDVLRQLASELDAFEFLTSGIFEHFLFSLLSFALIFILFVVLYVTVPLRKLSRKATLVSALWAALLWELAKQLFGYYIYNFGSLGRIYGTYALVVVVAFWIYYSSVVFIIGAEIGRLYYERRMVKGQTISDTGRINVIP